jgi:hypothetical protein
MLPHRKEAVLLSITPARSVSEMSSHAKRRALRMNEGKQGES